MKSFTLVIPISQIQAFLNACSQNHFLCVETGRRTVNATFEVKLRNPNAIISPVEIFRLGQSFEINNQQENENQ